MELRELAHKGYMELPRILVLAVKTYGICLGSVPKIEPVRYSYSTVEEAARLHSEI